MKTALRENVPAGWFTIRTFITISFRGSGLGNLQGMILDKVSEWIRNTIIVKAVIDLVAMCNPAGAAIQAIIKVFNTISFFLERAKQIAQFVGGVVNSVTDMANGKIDAAAARVETSIANGLTLLISFMAKFIGLGGVGKKVRSVVDEVRKPVQKPVDSTIDWLVDQGEKLFAGGKALLEKGKNAVASGVEKVKNFLFPSKKFKAGNEEHTIFFKEGSTPVLMLASDPK